MNTRFRIRRAWVLAATCGAVAGLTTLLATCGSDARQGALVTEPRQVAPLENAGPLSVRIRETWRRELDEDVDALGGMAVWDDGTIWIGSGDHRIWEMSAVGETLQAIGEPAPNESVGRALALLAMPDRRSVLRVGRNGTTFHADRRSPGLFSAMDRSSVSGVAAVSDSQFVLSYGQYPGDPHEGFALHRYAVDGSHVVSWRAAFPHEDWSTAIDMTGGPIATTATGDLLLADMVPPFRIVRYPGGTGDSAMVMVQDEGIVPREELDRALPGGNRRVMQWNRPVFIDEMPDGNILTVIRYYPAGNRPPQGLWVVVSPAGEVLAKTRFDESYWFIAPAGNDGRYVAWLSDGIVMLDVTLE